MLRNMITELSEVRALHGNEESLETTYYLIVISYTPFSRVREQATVLKRLILL
jgi:hypothetical protein